jgi:hypothetical protein
MFSYFFLYLVIFYTAHNSSSSSVRISWKAPALNTIHGEFLGYRITYRVREKEKDKPEDIKEIYIRDSSVEVCAVINLNYDFVSTKMRRKGRHGVEERKCEMKLTLSFILHHNKVDIRFFLYANCTLGDYKRWCLSAGNNTKHKTTS